MVRLIHRLVCSAGMLTERHPRQVAAGQVVALGVGVTALAFFGPRQLFEAAMKLLHLPANLHGINDHLPRQVSGQVIGNKMVG